MHDFQRFAAKNHSRADLDRLTEEEEQVLLLRRRNSPTSVAMQLNMSVETVHRRQRSIRAKLE